MIESHKLKDRKVKDLENDVMVLQQQISGTRKVQGSHQEKMDRFIKKNGDEEATVTDKDTDTDN